MEVKGFPVRLTDALELHRLHCIKWFRVVEEALFPYSSLSSIKLK